MQVAASLVNPLIVFYPKCCTLKLGSRQQTKSAAVVTFSSASGLTCWGLGAGVQDLLDAASVGLYPKLSCWWFSSKCWT